MSWLGLRRAPDKVLGNPAAPYLLRWHIVPRNRWFNIYLHHILRSDDDRAPHDHPWHSLSICLGGSMLEHIYDQHIWLGRRWIRKGAITYRAPEFLHRLEIPETSNGCWTLFITGPRLREWGFACDPDSPAGGWRHWRLFTKVENPGEVGRGCGP